jgi:ribosomal protein S18 acetylase RimI-like enzyme
MEQPFIRTATLDDLDALERLENVGFSSDRFSRARLRDVLRKSTATTFALEVQGQVAGSAIVLWRKRSSIARLLSIVVDPANQRSGLGSILLHACEDAAKARQCRLLRLEVRVDNTGALAFYGKAGYRNAGLLPENYMDGADGYMLVKDLGTGRGGGAAAGFFQAPGVSSQPQVLSYIQSAPR